MSKAGKLLAAAALIAVSIVLPPASATLASILFSVGSSLALGVLAQSLAPGVGGGQRRNGQELEYAGTVEPSRIIYGTNRVSGMNVIPPWTSGDNNQYLHQVLVFCRHEVSGFGDVYFNDDVIHHSDIRSVSNTLGSGRVLSGQYQDAAWIRRRVGNASQAVDYILNQAFPTEWDSNHRGLGVAHACLQFLFDEEKFPQGKPEASFVIDGKIIYDPRIDTGGLGDDPTNNAFRAFSSNPALILADYLIDTRLGLGEDKSRIDWVLVAVAANICDENVLIPPASPATHQKRYTCNVVLEVALSDEEMRNNITLLAAAMLGQAVFTNGQWRMFAGAASTETFTLDADDLAGNFTIRTEVPSNEKYNYVRGQFVDAARGYQLSEFEPRSNAAYEVEDLNKQLPKEVNFTTCTNQYEAQRNAMVILKRSRRRKQLIAEFAMSAYKMRVWDVGTMTMDEMLWDEQLVRCTSWVFGPSGTIQVTFLEEEPTDWDDPAVADYDSPTTGSNVPGRPGYIPPSALNFTAIPKVDGILFGFQYPAGTVVGTRAYIYMADVGDPFSAAVRVTPNFTTNNYLLTKTDIDPKDYWLTLQNFRSPTQPESEPVGPVTAAALELTTSYHLNIDSNTRFKLLVNVSAGNTETVTVTPVNGSSPYTYAWTKDSGDAITVNSPSSATTAFHASGMIPGQKRVARMKCHVVDNAAAALDISVTVTFQCEADA